MLLLDMEETMLGVLTLLITKNTKFLMLNRLIYMNNQAKKIKDHQKILLLNLRLQSHLQRILLLQMNLLVNLKLHSKQDMKKLLMKSIN